MWGQTFQTGDIAVVAVLVLLEALLSADNALVLALMVKHLPKDQQKRALLYGLGGAFVFRLAAILLAKKILALWWLQLIGAVYLLYLPIKHFINKKSEADVELKVAGKGFWGTVVAVELTDIAFAIDSVLAGVAMVKDGSKIWVIYFGAIIGIVLLRFAASMIVRLLERYPDLDHMAYLLVGWVGVKLALMSGHSYAEFERQRGGRPLIETPEMSPIVFWVVMTLIAVIGGWHALRNPQPVAEDDPEVLAVEQVEETLR